MKKSNQHIDNHYRWYRHIVEALTARHSGIVDGLFQAAQVMNHDTPVYMTFGSAGDFNIMGRFSVDGNYD